jgi:hypothetical protein
MQPHTDSDSHEDKRGYICGISDRLDSTATYYNINIHTHTHILTHTHNIKYYLLVERYIQKICGGFMLIINCLLMIRWH